MSLWSLWGGNSRREKTTRYRTKKVRNRKDGGRNRLQIEQLEQRVLLTTSLVDGLLTVDGTSRRDVIQIFRSGTSLITSISGQRSVAPLADVASLVVRARGGNDTVRIRGNVVIPATILGGGGNDTVVGGGDRDVIIGGGGIDRLVGQTGNDVLRGGPGDDRLFGQAGNDRLVGQAGNDILYGGPGNDRLYGQDGDDRLYGEAGNDFLYGGLDDDRLYGQAGDDWLYGAAGNDVLYGGLGDDQLYGQAGDDRLYGEAGNDVLNGGLGADYLEGPSGGNNGIEPLVFLTSESAQNRDLNGDFDTLDQVLQAFDPSTGVVRNSGQQAIEGSITKLDGLVAFLTSESDQDRDLNGDFDKRDNVLQVFDTNTGEVRNSGQAIDSSFIDLGYGLLAFLTPESDQNRDLNGDFDKFDRVLQVFDAKTGEVRNSGQQAVVGTVTDLGGGLLALLTSESAQDRDLNGDFDKSDSVLQLFNAKTGEVQNTGLAIESSIFNLGDGLLAFLTSESAQDRDLNGDFDRLDRVLQVFDVKTNEVRNTGQQAIESSIVDLGDGLLAFLTSESAQDRDLNGDFDRADQVLQVFDAKTGEVRNSGQQAIESSIIDLGDGVLAFLTSESDQDRDLNGDFDRADRVLQAYDAKKGEVRNSGQQAIEGSITIVGSGLLAFLTSEFAQDRDLNGDFDKLDRVLQVFDTNTGEVRNTGQAVG